LKKYLLTKFFLASILFLDDRSVNSNPIMEGENMSPRIQEQFKQMREASKEQIISAALKLFSERGYHAASIEQIAREAEVSKGLMYNYFAGKEKLLEEVIERGFSEMELLMGNSLEKETEAHIELEIMLKETAKTLKNKPSFWRLYFGLIFQPDIHKKIEPMVSQFRSGYISAITSLFSRLGRENSQLQAMMLGVELDGIGVHYLLAPEDFPLDELIELLIQRYCKNTLDEGCDVL